MEGVRSNEVSQVNKSEGRPISGEVDHEIFPREEACSDETETSVSIAIQEVSEFWLLSLLPEQRDLVKRGVLSRNDFLRDSK